MQILHRGVLPTSQLHGGIGRRRHRPPYRSMAYVGDIVIRVSGCWWSGLLDCELKIEYMFSPSQTTEDILEGLRKPIWVIPLEYLTEKEKYEKENKIRK